MNLSSLNIWGSWHSRRAQQEREVERNSKHPKMIWKKEEHRGWGDSISWMDWDKRKLMGHTTPLPAVGDELHCQMQSGKVATFRFKKINPCTDPSDMWFATVEDQGYLNET